jgi:nucleoside-diphosphate-sugar epimerase
MKVFVTGATGFVGSAVVDDLIKAGHRVVGMARSEAGAKALEKADAEVHRGELTDLKSLQSGASNAEGVIHTAFIHDFSKFAEVCEVDRQAVEALSAALAGSDRPLIVTAGTALAAPGRVATEDDVPLSTLPRAASEYAAEAAAAKGVRAMVVRLPQVHDTVKQGLVTYLIGVARGKGVSAYVGEGQNRWAAVHRLDAARVYRLALEKGVAGARYHAVAEEGVRLKQIAEAIGNGLKVPVVALSQEEAGAHFGWLGMFAGYDIPVSSRLTQERLGWKPAALPGLITDLQNMRYFET